MSHRICINGLSLYLLALETPTHPQGLRLRRVRTQLALALRALLLPLCKVGTREYGFRSSVAGLRLHLPKLHPEYYSSQRRVRGRTDSLSFLCKSLSNSISSRVIPELSLTPSTNPTVTASWSKKLALAATEASGIWQRKANLENLN